MLKLLGLLGLILALGFVFTGCGSSDPEPEPGPGPGTGGGTDIPGLSRPQGGGGGGGGPGSPFVPGPPGPDGAIDFQMAIRSTVGGQTVVIAVDHTAIQASPVRQAAALSFHYRIWVNGQTECLGTGIMTGGGTNLFTFSFTSTEASPRGAGYTFSLTTNPATGLVSLDASGGDWPFDHAEFNTNQFVSVWRAFFMGDEEKVEVRLATTTEANHLRLPALVVTPAQATARNAPVTLRLHPDIPPSNAGAWAAANLELATRTDSGVTFWEIYVPSATATGNTTYFPLTVYLQAVVPNGEAFESSIRDFRSGTRLVTIQPFDAPPPPPPDPFEAVSGVNFERNAVVGTDQGVPSNTYGTVRMPDPLDTTDGEFTITATVNPHDATNREIAWSSSPSIADLASTPHYITLTYDGDDVTITVPYDFAFSGDFVITVIATIQNATADDSGGDYWEFVLTIEEHQ